VNRRVKLTFPPHLIRQPVIGELVRRFDVMPNIRRADVSEDVGWIVCELDGDGPAVDAAISWLAESGVAVDDLEQPLEG
jgi:L-aspartate semialdehyde sulfurtransferase ferredoxin